VTLGLTLIFYTDSSSSEALYTLDDRCALLTFLPFAMVLLSNMWNEGDHADRRVFAFERERGYYSFPIFSPLCSLFADIAMHKLFPPLFASLTLYPILGLRKDWKVWGLFVGAMCLMQIAGACFCKAMLSVMAVFKSFVPVKAAMVGSFLLSLQVLFTGSLVDLSRSRVMKELSIFYWGCNVLYWGELGGEVTSTGVRGDQLLESYSLIRLDPSHAFRVLWLHIGINISVVLLCTLCLHGDWRTTKQQKKQRKLQQEKQDEQLQQ
jgi:hypothetical protein